MTSYIFEKQKLNSCAVANVFGVYRPCRFRQFSFSIWLMRLPWIRTTAVEVCSRPSPPSQWGSRVFIIEVTSLGFSMTVQSTPISYACNYPSLVSCFKVSSSRDTLSTIGWRSSRVLSFTYRVTSKLLQISRLLTIIEQTQYISP